MKRLILISLVLLATSPVMALDNDKKQHFWVSAGISSMVYIAQVNDGNSPEVSFRNAVLFTVAVGLTKEVFLDDRIDSGDMFFNSLGALSVPLILKEF